jgi:hypothetical protein
MMKLMAREESSHYHCYSYAGDCAPLCVQPPTGTTRIPSMILMTLQNSKVSDSVGNWESKCPSSGMKYKKYRFHSCHTPQSTDNYFF